MRRRNLIVAAVAIAVLGAVAWFAFGPGARIAPGPDTKTVPVVQGEPPARAAARAELGFAREAADVAAPPTGPSIDVEVRDDAGEPAAGAMLVVSVTGGEDCDTWAKLAPVGTTDVAGRVRVVLPSPAARCLAAFRGDREFSAWAHVLTEPPIRLRLARLDVALEGRVVEEDGTGVADASVRLQRQYLGGVGLRSRIVRCDAAGNFRVSVSSAWGMCVVGASDERRLAHLEVEVGGEPVPPLRLVLPAFRAKLAGIVTDWTGVPVAGASVLASPRDPDPLTQSNCFSAASGPDGHYEIPLFAAGEYDVASTGTKELPWSATVRARVTEVGPNWLPLQLAEPGSIHGTVRDAKAGERLTVRAFHVAMGGMAREVEVGRDGTFRIEGLMAAARYALQAFRGDDAVAEGFAVAGAGVVVELRNPLGRGVGNVACELTGEARDAVLAAATHEVVVYEVRGTARGRELGALLGRAAEWQGERVVVEQLPAVDAALAVVMVGGEERGRSAVFRIGAEPASARIAAEPLGALAVELPAPPEGELWFGEVLAADGVPLASGAMQRLRPGGEVTWRLPAGTWTLRVIVDRGGDVQVAQEPRAIVARDATTRLRAR